MKIIVCEDNKKELDVLLCYLERFFTNKDLSYEVKICTKAEEIYKLIPKTDLIFLDIEGLDVSGIDIGIKIRKMNPELKIVFTTNYSKYLIDGYKASANYYFLKPIEWELFEMELNTVINDYLYNYTSFIDLNICPDKIYINHIMYVEYKNRKSYLKLINGKELLTPYSLKYWIETLNEYYFEQPHKSFFVNMNHVKDFTKKDVILNNDEVIPLSRLNVEKFERAYVANLKRSMNI